MPTEWERGYAAGFAQGMAWGDTSGAPERRGNEPTRSPFGAGSAGARKRPRKVSAYHKRLGRILKRLKDRHTLKSGKWRKGWNQSRLMKAAHKEAKRK